MYQTDLYSCRLYYILSPILQLVTVFENKLITKQICLGSDLFGELRSCLSFFSQSTMLFQFLTIFVLVFILFVPFLSSVYRPV